MRPILLILCFEPTFPLDLFYFLTVLRLKSNPKLGFYQQVFAWKLKNNKLYINEYKKDWLKMICGNQITKELLAAGSEKSKKRY